MGRIRSIRPEFCTSLDIVDLSHGAQLHFVRLWTIAVDTDRRTWHACWDHTHLLPPWNGDT